MTTNQLLTLQKSITQGEWKAYGCAIYTNSAATCGGDVQIASAFIDPTGDRIPTDDEIDNAVAISSLPQLLAEVISLRKALETITQLDMPCMSRAQEDGFKTRTDLDHWRIVLGGLLVQAKMTARAALANE